MSEQLPRYFAVASPKGEVSLLVRRTGGKLGAEVGEVINGAWTGTFSGTEVYVHETKQTYPGRIVWRGDREVPFSQVVADIAAGNTRLSVAELYETFKDIARRHVPGAQQNA